MSRPSTAAVAVCVAMALLAVATFAAAQTSRAVATGGASRGPRLDVSVIGGVATGGTLGSADASLIANTTPGGGVATLFTTQRRLAAAPLGEVRVGVRLVRGWVVEGGVGYGRPELQVRLSGDIEGAPDVTATSRLTQVVADGALVHRWRRRKLSPFVLGGAGYLRQLDEPRTTVGTGQVYFGGGGVLVGLGRPAVGGVHRWLVRGDVRVLSYRGGLSLVDERPAGVIAAVGLTLRMK